MFSAATAAVEGKMSKTLKKLMKKLVSSDTQEELAVADAKLGNIIKVRKWKRLLAKDSVDILSSESVVIR